MTEPSIEEMRRQVGRGTALWAGPEGVREQPGRWSALTGADAVDYNVVCCHGPEGVGQAADAVREIKEAGVMGIVMLAGEARDDAATMEQAGWVRIGQTPMMLRDLGQIVTDPDIRYLTAEDLVEARALVVRAFGVTEELAVTALPDTCVSAPGHFAVGLFLDGAMACCVGGVVTGGSLVGWSMAVDPEQRRRGYAARTMAGIFHGAAELGGTRSVHISSPIGEPFYIDYGYELVERWDMWSRRRWTFGQG